MHAYKKHQKKRKTTIKIRPTIARKTRGDHRKMDFLFDSDVRPTVETATLTIKRWKIKLKRYPRGKRQGTLTGVEFINSTREQDLGRATTTMDDLRESRTCAPNANTSDNNNNNNNKKNVILTTYKPTVTNTKTAVADHGVCSQTAAKNNA